MRTFEDRVITNIFGSKTEELTREWTEIRKDEIHNQILFGISNRGRRDGLITCHAKDRREMRNGVW